MVAKSPACTGTQAADKIALICYTGTAWDKDQSVVWQKQGKEREDSGRGITHLVCVCMDSRRLSGWHLLLDSSHSPIGHQDELGGKRHIAAQGPVHLQQVPQLWLLRIRWCGMKGMEVEERKKDKKTTSKQITKEHWAAMSHTAKPSTLSAL